MKSEKNEKIVKDDKGEKDYFSSSEAAELLGVAVSTIQLWTNNGLLSAWTTGGGHRRIARGSVNEILEQQQAASADQDQDQEQKISIVVVDDDAQQRSLYKKYFNMRDVNVNMVMAENGYEGLIKIGSSIPDVIITDLVMPKMDGFQMVRALKELTELQHSLIVVITALTEDEVKERGGLPDGVQFFTKPVSYEKLEMLINKKAHTNKVKRAEIS